jgi:hypothetical protein
LSWQKGSSASRVLEQVVVSCEQKIGTKRAAP